MPDGKDDSTGLPIISLYGKDRKPRRQDLEGLDALVYDIQDIGTRFYTYITTLGLVLEAAKESGKKVFVLDRPNPIGGLAVSGPVRDQEFASFIAYHPLPVRHGMTVGELALLYNTERKIGASVEVVKCRGWSTRRSLRSHRARLDQPLAQHAQPDRGAALPRRRPAGSDQPGDRPGHRYAVRAGGSTLDRSGRRSRPRSMPRPFPALGSSRSTSRPRNASTPANGAAACRSWSRAGPSLTPSGWA